MIENLTNNLSVWEKLSTSDKPIILYGMGNGADNILDEFERLGIKCTDIFASDNFVRHQNFRDFTVKKLEEIERCFDDFIVCVAFATCIDEVISNIIDISKKHRLFVPCVPVYGNEIFNRKFVIDNSKKIEAAYTLLADDESKRVYKKSIEYMYGGELDILLETISEKSDVFKSFFELSKEEDYLDLGAYKGDTVDEFLKFSNSYYSSITAVEPDIKTFLKLKNHLENYENTSCLNICVSDNDEFELFNAAAGRQSSINSNGKKVKSVRIDSLYHNRKVTYIKADVEGAETKILLGAEKTLKKYKPKLNIAAYHRSFDIFNLVLMINSINPDYKIYIRRHKYIPCWDLNIYCV